MTYVESAARRTQSARRSYWAAVADGNAWRTERAAQALRISEKMLLREVGGSHAKALAAETAGMDAL